jgi:hypothetical protein
LNKTNVSGPITASNVLPIPSESFALTQSLMARSAFRRSQIIPQTGINNHSCTLISHKSLTSQRPAQSQKFPSDKVRPSNDFDQGAGIISSIHCPFSQNPLTQSPLSPSENINSHLLCSHKFPRSETLFESQMQSS